jgi:hypothetical protein
MLFKKFSIKDLGEEKPAIRIILELENITDRLLK